MKPPLHDHYRRTTGVFVVKLKELHSAGIPFMKNLSKTTPSNGRAAPFCGASDMTLICGGGTPSSANTETFLKSQLRMCPDGPSSLPYLVLSTFTSIGKDFRPRGS